MNRPACAVTVALSSPLAACLAAVALHTGSAIAPTFAALLIAAPIISRPHATEGTTP